MFQSEVHGSWCLASREKAGCQGDLPASAASSGTSMPCFGVACPKALPFFLLFPLDTGERNLSGTSLCALKLRNKF